MMNSSIRRWIAVPRLTLGHRPMRADDAQRRGYRRPAKLLAMIAGGAMICASLAATVASDPAEARGRASAGKASGGFSGGRGMARGGVYGGRGVARGGFYGGRRYGGGRYGGGYRHARQHFRSERAQFRRHTRASVRQHRRDLRRWSGTYRRYDRAGKNLVRQQRKYGFGSRQYRAAARRYGRAAVRNDKAARTYTRHARAAVKRYRQDRWEVRATGRQLSRYTGRRYGAPRYGGLRQIRGTYRNYRAQQRSARRAETRSPTYRRFNQAGRNLVRQYRRHGFNSRTYRAASRKYGRAAVKNDAAARKRTQARYIRR
jgi:hypothetical protein